MESEVKYDFIFRDNRVELTMLQLQKIITMLDEREDVEYIYQLLQLWQNEFTKQNSEIENELLKRQINDEARRERGDD